MKFVKTALWPLQVSLFQRLTNDADVMKIVTGVFDHVPADQAYPYVVIGEPVSDPWDTKTTTGEQIAIVIHVWSQYKGKKECYDILNACLQATSNRLSIEGGFSIENQERTNMTVFDDIDGKTRHGVLRLRYTINNK
ncbi:DUF3168 domain-containing protein [Virgibacillus halodenitrificans]|uniref:DUF3168 domain-containing protein n=1 Tax=Virgibacillus halodenitrificans TaxID=1482 RepID=UPI001FB538BD|nr:DUF3168 domain-containing protein [Virgibacillus halodenitrificans]MCJ0932923.1 DUF3168 domain-containing protein [Virgibacillus halodenitrificans]